MTRTRPFPYLFLISGTGKTSSSIGEFARLWFHQVQAIRTSRPQHEQRSCDGTVLQEQIALGTGLVLAW
jgi:hypothetical protein